MTAREVIQELFDRPTAQHKVVVDMPDLFSANFTTGKEQYTLTCEKEGSGWTVNFSDSRDRISRTRSGDQFAVFAGVLRVLSDWVARRKPARIHFTALEPSRQSLYKRMGERLAAQYGYVFKAKSDFIGMNFTLVRAKPAAAKSPRPQAPAKRRPLVAARLAA